MYGTDQIAFSKRKKRKKKSKNRKILCVSCIVLFGMRKSQSPAKQEIASLSSVLKIRQLLYFFLCVPSTSSLGHLCPSKEAGMCQEQGRKGEVARSDSSTACWEMQSLQVKHSSQKWEQEEPNNAGGNPGLGVRRVERELSVVLRRVASN